MGGIRNALGTTLRCAFNPMGCPRQLVLGSQGPTTQRLVEAHSGARVNAIDRVDTAAGRANQIVGLAENFNVVSGSIPVVGEAGAAFSLANSVDDYMATMESLSKEGFPGVIHGTFDAEGNPDPNGRNGVSINAIGAGVGERKGYVVVTWDAEESAFMGSDGYQRPMADVLDRMKEEALAQIEEYRASNPLPEKRYSQGVMFGDDPPEDIPDVDWYEDPYQYKISQTVDALRDMAPERNTVPTPTVSSPSRDSPFLDM